MHGVPKPEPVLPVQVAIAMPGGFEFGGIGRMMMYLTSAWRDLPGSPRWHLLDPRGTGSIAASPIHLASAIATLRRLTREGRVDLLHLNVAGRGSTLRKLALAATARQMGVPTIVHLHDYDYGADYDRRWGPVRREVRRMFQGAARVVVLGRRDRDTVATRLGVAPERIVVIHNAVPDPGPTIRTARPGEPVRIVFLGHLSERKGIPELLRAFAGQALRTRDWRAVLVGGGADLERFREEGRRLGLGDRVEFRGWVDHDEVWRICRDADLFTLPSHAEGQAMSLLEAMAHGLAIVTTPVGAHLEAVTHESSALLVPPGDSEALAAALARLIDSPSERLTLGRAAREAYLRGFSVASYARRMQALYADVLAEPRSSRSRAA